MPAHPRRTEPRSLAGASSTNDRPQTAWAAVHQRLHPLPTAHDETPVTKAPITATSSSRFTWRALSR